MRIKTTTSFKQRGLGPTRFSQREVVRLTTDFSVAQAEWIAGSAKARGVTLSTVVRDAIDRAWLSPIQPLAVMQPAPAKKKSA